MKHDVPKGMFLCLGLKGKEKKKANTHYIAPIDTQLSYRHMILCKYMQSQGQAEDRVTKTFINGEREFSVRI